MGSLPRTSDSLLVRTAAASMDEWMNLVAAVRTENADGFRAYVQFVDDVRWCGATQDDVRSAIPENGEGASVLFIADDITLTTEGFPVLVVDLQEGRPSFRCAAADLWAVDNNLNIANVDWEDFADAVDEQGVYRSEPPAAPAGPAKKGDYDGWGANVEARSA